MESLFIRAFNRWRVKLLTAWEFIQRPLPITILALLSGISGVIFLPWLLLVCEILLVFDLYAFGKAKDKSYPFVAYAMYFVLTAGCLLAAYSGATKLKDLAEQQRLQTMFAHDREEPLTDVYAVLKLSKVVDPPDLANFDFALKINLHTGEEVGDKVVVLEVHTTKKQPTLYPRVVTGMNAQAGLYPTKQLMTSIFVWDYFGGLNRIELGGYRSIPGAPMKLDELDKAFIQIVGTSPLTSLVEEVVIVANRYVVLDIRNVDMAWRPASKSDFEALAANVPTSDFLALESPRTTISLSDLVVDRRPLAMTELPIHPIVDEIRVVPGQHGWLIADKELF